MNTVKRTPKTGNATPETRARVAAAQEAVRTARAFDNEAVEVIKALAARLNPQTAAEWDAFTALEDEALAPYAGSGLAIIEAETELIAAVTEFVKQSHGRHPQLAAVLDLLENKTARVLVHNKVVEVAMRLDYNS